MSRVFELESAATNPDACGGTESREHSFTTGDDSRPNPGKTLSQP